MSSWHLAIDFGTSNTAAAHTSASSGEVETLPLSHQGNLMPSAVFADEKGIYVGHSARNHAGSRPDAFLASPKRVIDHDAVTLGGRSVEVSDLVGAVLHRVIETAKKQHGGADPETVTLTHPEAWSAHALNNLKAGAAKAGVDASSLHTISEPRSAARFYSKGKGLVTGDRVAVFDFGGGTLDIAVLERRDDGSFQVVTARGDNSLGGRNVDALIRNWVLRQLEEDEPQLAGYLRSAPASVTVSLDHSIREAKEILSDTPSATITVSTPQGETNLLLTRDEFEELLVTDIDRAVALTQATLRDAGAGAETATLYLTGGSARIPYVQQRLGEVCQVATLDDPKTVVARGALMATLSGAGAGDSAADDNPFAGMSGGAAAGAAGAGAAGAGAAAAAGAAAQQGETEVPRPAGVGASDAEAGRDQSGDGRGAGANANPYGGPGAGAGAGAADGAGAASGAAANQWGSGGPQGVANQYGSGGPQGPGNQYGSGGPQGPGNQYGSGAPQGPGSQYGAAAPSSSSKESGGSKAVPIAIGAIIVLVVAVGGFFGVKALTGGGDSAGEETAAEGAGAVPMGGTVEGLPQEVADKLPTSFLESLVECHGSSPLYCDFTEEASTSLGGVRSVTVQAPASDTTGKSLMEYAEESDDPAPIVLNEANPRAIVAPNHGSSEAAFYVYYEDSDILVSRSGAGTDSNAKALADHARGVTK
ncbi:Hsp70 family protein [Corynebacterium sp. 335C]